LFKQYITKLETIQLMRNLLREMLLWKKLKMTTNQC